MQKILRYLVILQACISPILSQTSIASAQITTFMKILGTPLSEQDISLVVTTNGDYIISATTNSVNNGDIIITKTNAIGEIQWTKAYGGLGVEKAARIVKSASNSYIVFGTIQELVYRQLLILQISQDGNLLAQRQIDYLTDISIGDAIAIENNGAYLVGVNLLSSFRILKLSSVLQRDWEQSFTYGVEPISVDALVEIDSNDYALCGTVTNDYIFHRFSGIPTYSESTNMQRYAYNTGDKVLCNHMIKSKLSQVVYSVGRVQTNPHQLFLAKHDISNSITTLYVISEFNLREGYGIVENSSGELHISGYSQGLLSQEMAVVSTNSAGVPISVKITGGTGDQRGYRMFQTADSGFLMTATTNTEGPGQTDLALVKFQDNLILCVYYDLTTNTFVSNLDKTSSFSSSAIIHSHSASSGSLSTPLKVLYSLPSVIEFNESTVCKVFSKGIHEELFNGVINECLCAAPFGTCNIKTKRCECQSGYSGFYCQYSETIYNELAPQVQAAINLLQTTLPSLTDQQILNDLTYITASPDLIVPDSALQVLTMLASAIKVTTPSDRVLQAMQIYSKISENARFQESSASIGKQLSQDIASYLKLHFGAGSYPNLQASKIEIKSSSYDPHHASSVESTDTRISMTSMQDVLTGHVYTFSSVVYNLNIYAGLAPTQYPSSPVVSLSVLNSHATQQKVSDLADPVKFRYSVSIEELESLLSRKTKDQIIADGDISCYYYDTVAETVKTTGCEVTDLGTQFIECACNHFTDFMAMLRSSYTTLTDSNYDALLAIKDVTLSSLFRNVGFYITVGYFGSFIILAAIFGAVDRAVLKNKLHLVVWTYLSDEKGNAYEIQADTTQNTSTIRQQYNETKKEQFGVIKTLRKRFTQIYHKERSHRCSCPRVSMKMAYADLSNNNQICNLFGKTSPLRGRVVRLSFFYLGLLAEISIAALFYDLSGSTSDSSSFWEGLVQNVFVALYSTLFALIPLVLLASLYQIPTKTLSRLRESAKGMGLNKKTILNEYTQMQRKMLCRRVFGGMLFFLLSSFFCLYLIGFGHTASASQEREWAISSFISIGLDILIFELLPAFLIGVFGSLLFCCSRFSLCLIVSLQFYRFLRNLADV